MIWRSMCRRVPERSERRLADDRTYTGRDGAELVLPGRALMFVRNVGLLMTTDALLDGAGRQVPEGILDAVMTVLAALHDLRKDRPANSRTGAVYVVKPKMHGPDEARLHRRPLRRGRGPPRPADAAHVKIGADGRGTSHQRQPRGVHPLARRSGSRSSTRASSTARATRSTPRWRQARWCARRAMKPQPWLGGLRGPQRRHRSGMRLPRPGPDRQGDVARSRSHGGDARGEDRPPARRARAAPGCPPPRRRRCMPPTTTASMCPARQRSSPVGRRRRSTRC